MKEEKISINLMLRKLRNVTQKARFSSPASQIAFAFDIDGVLIQGKHVLEEGRQALKLLHERNITFCFLTNGGGVSEAYKAAQLSEWMKIPISEKNVVLSHSPMKMLVPQYRNQFVCVVGSDSSKDVAKDYGFQKAVLPKDIFNWNPSVWPFKRAKDIKDPGIDFKSENISAVMIFNDSKDWGLDAQVIVDLMRSVKGQIGTQKTEFHTQSIPLYTSNSDFIWKTDFPVNRFAQGAFRLAVESLYKELSGGHELVSTKFGKPEHLTYVYCSEVLKRRANELWPAETSPCRTVYCIGDNPASDIRGANSFRIKSKSNWKSILVQTGVWTPTNGQNSNTGGADYVVPNVLNAVQMALEKHELL